MINGDYYTPMGIRLAVANAIARFEAVGQDRVDTVANVASDVVIHGHRSRVVVADQVPAPDNAPQSIVTAGRL